MTATAAPGPNDIDERGTDVYQRSHLVIANDVRIKVVRGGAIQDESGAKTVFSAQVTSIVKLSQAAYDALSSPDEATLYLITA